MRYSFNKKLTGFLCFALCFVAATAGIYENNNSNATYRYFESGTPEGLIGTTDNSPVDNPFDNLFHVQISTELNGTEQAYLVYELEGVQDHASVSRSINDQLSVGGYLVKKRKGWAKQRERISVQWLKQGDNVIRFTIPEGADYGYRVRNVRVELGADSKDNLVVSQPAPYYFNNKAYVKGFVQSAGNHNLKVRVGGKEARLWHGAFEAVIEKPLQAGTEWFTQVEVFEGSTLIHKKTVRFAEPMKADYQLSLTNHTSFAQKFFVKEAAGTVALHTASISIPKGALKSASPISITMLRNRDIPALDAGMVNVTGGNAGYRFLPHGTTFHQEASLRIGYDAEKIPDGYTIQDIKTFYFDEKTHHWIALRVDTVLESSAMVMARTSHFTDMINAVIQVPESPEVQAYNSNTMKGIKAATPTANINLINPPAANNSGTASLGFPINVPAGRAGLQPQLGIGYNSGGSNGWLGLGWNLSVPAIGIDTRWGVPRYDGQLETETYTFSGEQLTPAAHRGILVARSSGDKQFYPRVEGSFSKIIRHGNRPDNYWWEVTEKTGARYFYGGAPETNSFDPDYVLRDADGNIAHWALKEVRDLNGNFIRYHYKLVQDAGVVNGTVAGYQLYVSKITYTGFNGEEGKYSILFSRDRELGEAPRTDVIINASLGFKQVTADLLRKIQVQFENKDIRSYELRYRKGDFEKTLLDSISEYNAAGKLFHTHKFEYFSDVRKNGIVQPFAPVENWNMQNDNVHGDFINPLSAFNDKASALSGTKSKDIGAALTVAVGFNPDVASKSVSVGGNFGYSQSTSDGMLTLVDINGDGLADKIYIKDDMIRYRKNMGGSEFGPERSLVTAPRSFHKERSKTVNGGVEASGSRAVPVFVGAGVSKTTSTTTTYITEVNGDQLPDIVANGTVYFNHINNNGDPEFTTNSGSTPSPIFQDGNIATIGTDQSALDAAIEENPLHDIVRMWQAPYSGAVTISAPVSLLKSNDPERADATPDGVRVAIQLKGTELWTKRIQADDYSTHTPHGVTNLVVQKGDRIYFRVQSVFHGLYDQVQWEPVISYAGKDLTETDANNLPRFRFDQKEEFLVTALQDITMPINGKLAITGSFTKPVSSDTVRLEIRKKVMVGTATMTSVVWTKTYLPGDAVTEPITMNFDVQKEHAYSFHMLANSNVDWSRIRWNPYIYYEASYDPNYPNVKDTDNTPLVAYYPVINASVLSKQLQVPEPYKIPDLVNKIKVRPSISFSGSALDILRLNGEIVFTVKKSNQLLAKQILAVEFGIVKNITEQEIAVAKDEKLFFEFHVPSPKLASSINGASAHVENKGFLPAGLHTAYEEEKDLIYGPMFRHWGQFAYNGNRLRATAPIDESMLKLSDAMKNQPNRPIGEGSDGQALENDNPFNPAKEIFIVLVPAVIDGPSGEKYKVWMGYDKATYVHASLMSSARLGDDDLMASLPDPNAGTGARAINKVSTTVNKSYSAGGSLGPVSGGLTRSNGDMNVISDFMDMNGDRYPDIVTKDKVQYTNARGGFSNRILVHGNDGNHHTINTSTGFSISGSYVTSESEGTAFNLKKVIVSVGSGQNSVGLNGSYGSASSNTGFTWMDINGDGLPDKVFQSGNTVALNLGYKFAAPEPWGFSQIQQSESKSTSAGLGVSIVNGSISAGMSFSRSDNNVTETLQDVNGDGLPDRIIKGSPMRVALNTGNGFAAIMNWNDAFEPGRSSSTSQSLNIAFTAGIYIPLINIKIVVNPSTSAGASVTRDLEKLSDMDGDGYPDYVSSSSDDRLAVARSTIGRTNLLRAVHRPMGALIVLDYQKLGNTYNMPSTVWAMSSVKVFDGYKGDGIDTMMTSFKYENGIYNRNEREFFGFEKVITHTHNTGDKNKIYLTTVQTFHNGSYYEKGLLRLEQVMDASKRLYKETENEYRLLDIHTGAPLPAAVRNSDDGNAFPALTNAYQRFFEGQPNAGKTTQTSFEYDAYGNIVQFTDFAEAGTDDDVRAVIRYHHIPAKHILTAPESIEVTAGGKLVRKREATIDNNSGDVLQIRQFADASQAAVHDFDYDEYGNIEKITGPANAKGQRMVTEYVYDDKVHSFPVTTSNSYGYSSSGTYDFRFGQILSSKDLNGNEMFYTLDAYGRVEKIIGPYEKGSGATYTIKFEYHHDAVVPWALTKHYDPAHPKNDMETATFTDGLGRVLQTKKDISEFQGDGKPDIEKMAVSGHVSYDGLGRTVAVHYPVTEPVGNAGIINKTIDAIKPTLTEYDVLNRVLSVTLPDGTQSTTTYGFANDKAGRLQFSNKTMDANGKTTEQFTDLKGQVLAVRNYSKEGDIWTLFRYNALNEQVAATDNLGNTTHSDFDMLGRRVMRMHPDAGKTNYHYDLAGNLVRLVTANLQADSLSIQYEYDFQRVTHVIYPHNMENNVRYTYGAAGARDNRAGRIVLQEDASGAQEFFYGPFGEITKNIRTIVIPHHDAQTFVTEWVFDTWSRLTSMTYPDGEKLSYFYNPGGLLRVMEGRKQGDVYPYVKQLGYDKFEQRVFLAYGNGTKTNYSYEPDRRRLQNMVATTAAGRKMMSNVYGYDKVNNIISLENNAEVPANNLMGGKAAYAYEYDDMYRLKSATGSFTRANEEQRYSLQMKYNTVGAILQKTQVHEKKGGEHWITQRKTTYDLAYTYDAVQPHAADHVGEQSYSYDANGNSTGWTHDKTGQRRRMLWDEENRLRAVYDNGALYHYVYDAAGERVLKGQGVGQMIYVNGEPKGGSGGISNFTIYVNPYVVLRGGGYTKHYYIENQRIVSKLGSGWDNNGKGPLKTAGDSVDYAGKYTRMFDGIVKNLKFLGVDGQILTVGKSGKVPPGQVVQNSNGGKTPVKTVESFQYYFHPDHLGSTSYITDASGEVYQHLEYMAFGETFIEEHSNTHRTPYLFNGKELDAETGLYYYGARYYDPRTSIWQSVDPMAEKLANWSPYNYTLNNPVRLSDPTGMYPDPPEVLYHNTTAAKQVFEQGFNAAQHGKNSRYNWFSATENATGTGRTGTGATLGVSGIDVSNAVEITGKQMRQFYEAAKAELGYTSDQIRNSKAIQAEVDGLKYRKLGEWMNQQGHSVYKHGSSYAVTDAVANSGTIRTINASSNVIRALNGLKIAGRVLMVVGVAMDAYEIHTSGYEPRTITRIAGGWAGAWAGASIAGSAYTATGLDLTGPWGWAGHAVVTIGGGVAGYYGGRKITETVYDLVTRPGFKR